jgi:hypothetical protein
LATFYRLEGFSMVYIEDFIRPALHGGIISSSLQQSEVGMAKAAFVILRSSEKKLASSVTTAKVGLGDSRLRLHREAKISGELTEISRLFSTSADPIINDLRRDDVKSFSARCEMAPQSDIAISGVSVKPLVAAVLFQARAIADHNRGESESGTNISVAKAAVLSNDMLTFLRVTQEMTNSELVDISDFAALTGHYAFVTGKPIFEDGVSVIVGEGTTSSPGGSLQQVWLDEGLSAASSAKGVLRAMSCSS